LTRSLKRLARRREELTRYEKLPKQAGHDITLVVGGQSFRDKSKRFNSSSEEERFLFSLLEPLAEAFLADMRERHENLIKEVDNE